MIIHDSLILKPVDAKTLLINRLQFERDVHLPPECLGNLVDVAEGNVVLPEPQLDGVADHTELLGKGLVGYACLLHRLADEVYPLAMLPYRTGRGLYCQVRACNLIHRDCV